ncbi:MAG TPA: hypothetical protein VJ869_17300 [Sphaerochaeta sp.]|nr:hypothetical protein [Sphaerochaeta sp.]
MAVITISRQMAYTALMQDKRFGNERKASALEVDPMLFKHVQKMLWAL